MTESVFAKYEAVAYPYTWLGTLNVRNICGGVPTDPKVAEAWIRANLGIENERLIQQAVAEVMAERGISADEAVAEVNTNKHLNGFKRDEHGLYVEGRQLKAAIKEAANVRWPYPHKWGRYIRAKDGKDTGGKASTSYFAEHVFVQEDRLYLGCVEPTGIQQRFVHTWKGAAGIQYEEYVEDAKIHFTVATDHDFTEEQWALLWITGGQQGLGSTRSQGFGRYTVTRWERA